MNGPEDEVELVVVLVELRILPLKVDMLSFQRGRMRFILTDLEVTSQIIRLAIRTLWPDTVALHVISDSIIAYGCLLTFALRCLQASHAAPLSAPAPSAAQLMQLWEGLL